MNPSRGRSRSNQYRREGIDSAPAPSGAGANVVVSRDGWGILLHPLLLDQLERVIGAAEHERSRRGPDDPAGANMKIAASLWQLLLADIPQDPSRSTYRQGNTLGGEMRHWMRAKFGNGRFRLFFRYHSKARVIVFAWVNDSETLRAYGSRTDAYAVFRRMLDTGNPPDDWNELVRASATPDTIRRARKLLGQAEARGSEQ
jgi:toxin YhaV